jgi:hypothetical protein
MQHINAIVVLDVHISSIVDKHVEEGKVSSEGGEMQGSKAVFVSPMVDPGYSLFFGYCLVNLLHEEYSHVFNVLEANHMHERVAPCIDDIHYWNGGVVVE